MLAPCAPSARAMPSPMPLVESVTTAALPLNIRELPLVFGIARGSARAVFGAVVKGDLAKPQRKVRDQVLSRHNLEHRQPRDVGDDVTEELELGRRVPRFLQDDVLEVIAHQLADPRRAVDMWYDLDHNGSRVEQFGGKWILVGYITFKKRCKDIVCMETMHMHWNGLHLDNLIGSLYKKVSDREVFLPIEDNLVCDGVWNERTQTLIFDFDEEENLGPTTTFCLVLTVPGKVESILKKGSFSIEHRCLPYPFSQSIQNENLVLAIR